MKLTYLKEKICQHVQSAKLKFFALRPSDPRISWDFGVSRRIFSKNVKQSKIAMKNPQRFDDMLKLNMQNFSFAIPKHSMYGSYLPIFGQILW